MNTWMRQFGFGEKTGVDLPSESSGLYPNPGMENAYPQGQNGHVVKPFLSVLVRARLLQRHCSWLWPQPLPPIMAIKSYPHVLRESRGA